MKHGHFTSDGGEFVITDPATPRPWHNYLANEEYLVNLTQLGTGASFYQPTGEGLRCNLTEDRHGDGGPRFVYLRDRDSGRHWSLTGAPGLPRDRESWECRVGPGYQLMASTVAGIAAVWRVLVPPGTDSCELWTLTVRNPGDRRRRIALTPYLEMHLTGGSTLMDFVSVLGGRYDPAARSVLGVNACKDFPPKFSGLLASDAPVAAATVSREEFLGPYGDYVAPRAVREEVHNPEAGTEWLGASLRHDLELAPGAQAVVTCLVGVIESAADGERLRERYLAPGATERLWAELQERNRDLVARNRVATGDAQADRWLNVWLKRQLQVVGDWGRVIGRGYRDMLQDCCAHRLVKPDLARHRLLEALAHQYPDGRCIRAWHLPDGRLDLQDYADSPAWLFPAVTGYIKETDDFNLLDAEIPYLDPADPYAPSDAVGPVHEHLLRAQRHLLADRGRHGLCRIRHGDWCDTMNGVGARGEGVSVLLSQQVKHGCDLHAELADRLGDATLAAELRAAATELAAAINAHAWDGNWYLRAFDDDGLPVGSATGPEGDGGELRLYLTPQAWALISGVADPERAAACRRAVEEHLDVGYGKTLNWPQSTFAKPRIGQTSAQTPGFYENGSVYTHGNCFWAAGLAAAGDGEAAWDALRSVLPDTPNKPGGDSEPFAVPNMYIGPVVARRRERSLYLSGWRTGSAAWIYKVALGWLLGLRAEYAGLRLAPQLPRDWADAEVVRYFRGGIYRVRYRGWGGVLRAVHLDGETFAGNLLPVPEAGSEHAVEVELDTSQDA